MIERSNLEKSEKKPIRNFYELFMFELINNHEIKIYNSQQKYVS